MPDAKHPYPNNPYSRRKDEHIALATRFTGNGNGLTDVHFVHQSIPTVAATQVDLSTHFLGRQFPTPLYINAMTGGSAKGKEINGQLAQIAGRFHLPMAVGSLSAALSIPALTDSFTIVREKNPDGFILANIGADKSPAEARRAVALLAADALQIHVNTVQETVMPEGHVAPDWLTHIAAIVQESAVPVVVKEVGFGMSQETLLQLAAVGVTTVDISGRGGTNFAAIENARRPGHTYDYLADWGLTTAQSLLESQSFQKKGTVLASGGITNPLDVLTALRLGAAGVGVAGFLLRSLMHVGLNGTSDLVSTWLDQLPALFALVNARNITELRRQPLWWEPEMSNYAQQRHLSLP